MLCFEIKQTLTVVPCSMDFLFHYIQTLLHPDRKQTLGSSRTSLQLWGLPSTFKGHWSFVNTSCIVCGNKKVKHIVLIVRDKHVKQYNTILFSIRIIKVCKVYLKSILMLPLVSLFSQ